MNTSKFFLSTLIAAAAMSSNAWADYTFSSNGNVTISQNTSHDSVSVGQGVEGAFVFDGNNKDLWIGNLKLEGNLVVSEDTCDLAEIESISGSGSLTLSKKSPNSWGGALVLSGDSTGYAGTINIWNGNNEGNNPGQYSQFLVLKSANAAGSATVNLGAATVLMISANETAIGGLNSQGSASSVVSRASSFGYGADKGGAKVNPYHTSYSGDNPVNDGTHRTLNITGDKAYEFKGTFGSSTNIGSLSLNWSGSGSQTFSGNTFVNNLTVSSGTFKLSGGSSTISGVYSGEGMFCVDDGAVLTMIGNDSKANQTAGKVTVNVGGKVRITGHDLMGWDGNANTAFVLGGKSSDEKMATLCIAEDNNQILTLSRSVEMVGNALVSSEGGSGFNTYGGKLIVSGKNNIVSSKILLRKAFEVEVAELGEVEISGNVSNHNDGSKGFKKSGLGKLTLSGDNAFSCALEVSEGTLAISGSVKGMGSVVVATGALLDLSGAEISLLSPVLNSGTVTVSSDTIFMLASSSASNGVYSVITNKDNGSIENWNASTLSVGNFMVDGDVLSVRSKLDFSTAGQVTITEGAMDLNWKGDGTWNTTNTNTPWVQVGGGATAQFFADKDSVAFGSSEAVVTLEGTVKPDTMKVEANTTFIGSGEIILSTPGKLTIASSAKLSLGEGVVLNLGSSASVLDLSLVFGTGTVKYVHTKDGGDSSGLKTSANFTGLVDYVGNLNWSDENNSDQVSIGNAQMTLRLSSRSGSIDGIWGKYDKTFLNAVEFGSDYKIYLDAANLTFGGTVSAGGKKLTIQGAKAVKFSGETTIGTLSHAGGSTVFTSSATVDEFRFDVNGSVGGTSTIEEGAVVNATTFHNSWGYKTLTVNGELNVSGSMNLLSGTENAVEGSGTINVGTLNAGNAGTYTFTGVTLNIGAGGITGNSRPLKFGKMTIGVVDGVDSWTTSRGFELSSSEGTTFKPAAGKSIAIGNVITGEGQLIKDGVGVLTLTNENTYAGGTTISRGTLVAARVNALGTGAVTINGGQLEVAAGVTLAQDAITIVLSDVYKTKTGVEGSIAAIAGAGTLKDGVTIKLEREAVTLAIAADAPQEYQSYTYQIFDSNSEMADKDWSFDISAWGEGWSANYSNGELTLTIPEPSTFGLLAGLGALTLVGTRRRRKKA